MTSPISLWKRINDKNWKAIKGNVDFYEKGITPENFNNIKIKPVKSPTQQTFSKRLNNKRKIGSFGDASKTQKRIENFRQRQKGLQTLCSPVFSKSKNRDGIRVDMMSQSIRGPLMPATYYSNVSLKNRYT